MKLVWLTRKIQACYLYSGFLTLVVCLLLAWTSLVQAADTRIAFMSTRNAGNGEIFLMNPDGKRVRQLTRHLQYDSAPAWSPDGQKITFASFRDLHKPKGIILAEIYVMNSDGTNPINLTQSPERADLFSSWSPDGEKIVFGSIKGFVSDVWVMDANGANQRNLTNHDALDRRPDWSPDGMRIAFESNRDGDWVRDRHDNWEVYVMNADGTNPINLTNNNRASDGRPAWEPAPNLSVAPKERLATLWGKVKGSR